MDMRHGRRRHRRGVLTAVAAGLGAYLLLAGAVGATGPTTITFSEIQPGTVVDSQYASQGVRFGKASEFGVSLAGAWDCGAPIVATRTSDGGPTPLFAQAPGCGGRSGTIVAFDNPRRDIRLVVTAAPSTDRRAEVLAFDRTGRLLSRGDASSSGFSPIAIDRPSPDVAFLAVQLEGEGESVVRFDDLVFDHLGDPLTLSPREVGATVGVERNDTLAFLTDADPTAAAGDYRVRIEWGDGHASDGVLAPTGSGYDVRGTHAYASTGTFAVRTTVEKVNAVSVSTTSTARVVDRPDFSVSVAPSSATAAQGSASYTVTVAPLAGFTGTVTLAVAGGQGTFAPAAISVPGTSTLTVGIPASPPGSYPLTITATSGSLSRTATATLTVTKSAPTVVAALAAVRPRPASSLVTLDARGTTGAARYRWDLNGDRSPDVECGGGSPVLLARLRTPGRRTVSVTAVAADGKTSVAGRTLQLGKRSGAGPVSARPLEVASCVKDARPYLEGRACAETVVFGLVEARGCFTRASRREDVPPDERAAFDEYGGDPALADPLVSHGPVKLNGLTFSPARRGAAIVVFPQIERIVSSGAEITLGAITVRGPGPVNFELAGTIVRPALGKARGQARLLSFAATTPLPELGGFRLAGEADVFLVKRGSAYTSETRVALAVPSVLTLFGGAAPTGRTVLVADSERGLVLDELSVRVPEAHLGAIRLTSLSFEYKARGNPEFGCPRRWWKATVNVFLGGGGAEGGFRLAPEPQRNGVAFCNGRFHSAGGEVVFGGSIPAPQLFPGVELRRIGFEIQLAPTFLVGGSATITAGRLTDVTGGLLMAFPSPAAPYTVRSGDARGTLGRLAGRTFVAPTLAVGGTFGLRVTDQLTIPFGNAYVAYSYPDYVAAGGSAGLVLPGMRVNVGVDGEMLLSKALFSLHGVGEVCIAGLSCLAGAEAWVTSTGFVACGSIADELHPGAGYRWGDSWPTIWLVDGCTPSDYWPDLGPNTLARGPLEIAATTTFTVQRGEGTKNVRLDGVGGAPRIEVRGPNGEVVSTSSGDYAAGRTIRILRQDAGKVTWIGVAGAAPGRYTVTALPGSVAFARVAATRNVDEHVRATVVGTGSTRALRYDVARVPGRRVTFFDRGASSYRPLGTVTGGRGTFRLPPAAGAGGQRQIVARVLLDGVPTPDRVLSRYRVSAPSRLSRPGALRVRRSGSAIAASWRRVPGAASYVVVLRLRGGAQRVVRTRGARTVIRLAAIPRTQSGAISIRAVGPLGSWGPQAVGRFAALETQASPFHPFAELGKPQH